MKPNEGDGEVEEGNSGNCRKKLINLDICVLGHTLFGKKFTLEKKILKIEINQITKIKLIVNPKFFSRIDMSKSHPKD